MVASGDNIVVTGSELGNVSQVLLDGQPLAVSNKSNSALTVTIPKGASSGYLRLMTSTSSMVLATVRIRVKRTSSSGNAASATNISLPRVGAYSTPVVSDLDLDGQIDLLLGDEDGNVWNFEQNTNNTFPTTPTLLTSTGRNGQGLPVTNYAKPAVTDLDGDGKLDLLVGTGTGQGVMRFEQLGNGSAATAFGPGSLLTTNGTAPIVSSADYPKPAITDLDGDGLLDLLLGDDGGRIARYEQQGPMGAAATMFTSLGFLKLSDIASTTIDVGGTSKPIVLDWDGNGLLDMLVGSSTGTVTRYEQSKVNGFAFVSKGGMTTNGTAAIDAGTYSAPAVTDLDNNGIRNRFQQGDLSNAYARAGVAVVISKSEKRAAFVDLRPLFAYYKQQYFGQSQSGFNSMIANRGDGASQWPYTFDVAPSQKPSVIKVVDLANRPTAVKVSLTAPFRAFVATQEGKLRVFDLGTGYLNQAGGGTPSDISERFSVDVGRNPTAISYVKEHGVNAASAMKDIYPNGYEKELIVTSRGDRKLQWVRFDAGLTNGSVARTLQESRMIDPISTEDADNHGTESYLVSVADYAGKGIHNFLYGPIYWHTYDASKACSTAKGGCKLLNNAPFEYGGTFKLPGKPFHAMGANIN